MSAPQKAPMASRAPGDVMRDRFYYVLSQCMSRRQQVTLKNSAGEQFAGWINTVVKEGVKLENCRKVGSDVTQPSFEFNDFQTIEFEIEEDRPQSMKFKRDKEISKAKAPGRRELQKYSPDTVVQHTLGDASLLEKFDQFETNKKLFGVTATFNEEQYTTPLVHFSELTAEQRHHSEQVIKALSHTSTLDDVGGEEEERFAAVQGTGRFRKEEKKGSRPALTNSSGELPEVKSEKLATERIPPLAPSKNYRQLRDDLVIGRRLHSGLVSNPESIEALLLEPATYRNDIVADDLLRFKEVRAKEAVKQIGKELKDFKDNYDRHSRKNSVVDTSKGKKDEQKEILGEIAEEIPVSLLDVFLDSLSEQYTSFDPVEPYWPPPSEHRAATVPPTHNSLLLNPDAPVFEFPLPLA